MLLSDDSYCNIRDKFPWCNFLNSSQLRDKIRIWSQWIPAILFRLEKRNFQPHTLHITTYVQCTFQSTTKSVRCLKNNPPLTLIGKSTESISTPLLTGLTVKHIARIAKTFKIPLCNRDTSPARNKTPGLLGKKKRAKELLSLSDEKVVN